MKNNQFRKSRDIVSLTMLNIQFIVLFMLELKSYCYFAMYMDTICENLNHRLKKKGGTKFALFEFKTFKQKHHNFILLMISRLFGVKFFFVAKNNNVQNRD